jgi:hypothetical protein
MGAHPNLTEINLAADPKVRAEAQHNAYQAALRRQDWVEALAALREAACLDPARFAPLPLDRYEPQRVLGAGGLGVAFLCRHRHLGRLAVVKSLLACELDRDAKAVFAEATALEDLDHPALVRARDAGYADEARTRPYLVLDYFDGVDLQSYVRGQGPLAPADLLAVARPVAGALQAANARGILHRGVKPANVLVRRGAGGWKVKLIDFGLAPRPGVLERRAQADGPQARTAVGRSAFSTLHYAAPEQLGRLPDVPVGAYSDVYSFGKTCYYALLETPDPDDVEKARLPLAWRQLLSRCTGRTVANRLPDFTAVLEELAKLPAAVPVLAAPARPAPALLKAAEGAGGAAGVPPPAGPSPDPVLYFCHSRVPVEARGQVTGDGFVVLAGSQAVAQSAPHIDAQLERLRTSLLDQAVLVPDGTFLRFTRNYTFTSPSAAAGVLSGLKKNGLTTWRDGQGRTLKQLQAAEPPRNPGEQ